MVVKQKKLKLLSWEEDLGGEKANPVPSVASSHNVSLHSGLGLSVNYVITNGVGKPQNISKNHKERK